MSAISGTDGVHCAACRSYSWPGSTSKGPWSVGSGADKVLLSGVGQRKEKSFRWGVVDPISESKHFNSLTHLLIRDQILVSFKA